ncbi:MAG TPA: hypothetical protein PLX66_00370 [Bacilli bacterium]|nr:hypothetical protein [Bacilli bacterium]
MKHIRIFVFSLIALFLGLFIINSDVYAASIVRADACYCCGGSQGCTYVWIESNETVGSNCGSAITSKSTEEACVGSSGSTESTTGACWVCGDTYTWTSGARPSSSCSYISTIKSASACSGDAGRCYSCENSTGVYYTWSDNGGTPSVNNICTRLSKSITESQCTGTDNFGEIGLDGEIVTYTGADEYEDPSGPSLNVTVGDDTCEGILGNGQFHQYLVDIFNIIRVLGIAMVIVFSSMDFAKALIAQDSEALKKASQTSIKRLGIAIAIFFVPILLNILLALIGLSGICI